MAAIVYLVEAGCSWTKLPAVMFGVGRSTVHRRFTQPPPQIRIGRAPI